jgi:hypothetical protein
MTTISPTGQPHDAVTSTVSSKDVRELLIKARDQILMTPVFRRSPVISRLLGYLINHQLDDPNHPPKAYAVAVDCLGRSNSFDPQTDSYPRVMVGRLRLMLEHHYAIHPSDLWLEIPQGRYEVIVHTTARSPQENTLSAKPRRPKRPSKRKTGLRRWIARQKARWFQHLAIPAALASAYILGLHDFGGQ